MGRFSRRDALHHGVRLCCATAKCLRNLSIRKSGSFLAVRLKFGAAWFLGSLLERTNSPNSCITFSFTSSKRRKSKGDEDDGNEEEASLISQEEKQEQEEAMNESSSEEDSDEEAEAPKPPPTSRKRKVSAAPSASKKKKSQVHKEMDAPEPKKKLTSLPKAGAALNRRQAVSALASLAKKVLSDPSETSENSLTAALLLSFHEDNKNKKRSNNDDGSYYTAGIQAVARRVLEQHKDDPRSVEVSLFNLILRSVGGASLLEADTELEDMSDDEWALKIEETVEEMEDTPADRVLLTANPSKASVGAVEFRKIFSGFWYQLAATTLAVPSSAEGNSDRFQVEWIRDILARLIELVGVGVPDIRFAFTTAIFQMGHAMLDHTAELRTKLETAGRQLSVAVRSKSTRKSEALEEQIDSWNRIVADLEEMVKDTVMAVFTQRFKDEDSYIRVASLEALTKYCRSRPDIFVSSYYLKYFGWMLSDKAPEVRVAAIKALLAPFQAKMDTSGMNSVLAKFLGRLADCILDVDVQVQEVAMELLLILLREGHFNEEENDRIWLQINTRALGHDTTPAVRRDALYFVIEQLDAFHEGPAKSEREAAGQLSALVQWYVFIWMFVFVPSSLFRP
jgi:cohesin complex subunit SA-1/2